VYEILTVCSGNICRSPLAALVLDARLPGDPRVASAGTHARANLGITPETAQLAASFGVSADAAAEHRSRLLTERQLASPALILAMTREHRRLVVEMAPARLRSTFTIREFARLARLVSDEKILMAAADAPSDDERVRRAVAAIASARGLGQPLEDPADDDVVDPYRRPWETYVLAAEQLKPALREVVRVFDVALLSRATG
jgi:protein-tyrosine phosphatase